MRKCPYCDFNSHEPRGELPEADYMQALQADLEFALATPDQRPFATVFIGGGTPSLFRPESIASLLNSLRHAGRLSPDAEITLEANPGALDASRFQGYRDAGVNRLSLGIQSFDDESLRRLGRIHDAAAARLAAEQAGEIFPLLNLDLMHGLPGQTAAGAIRDVETALALAPAHLSCYQLTLEPNTVFAKYPPGLPPESELADIEAAFLTRLEQGGYEHYEISAHALPGRQCRHNRHYWEFADYLGIGAGAHSKLTRADGIWRERRVRSPGAYMQRAGSPEVLAERRQLREPDLLPESMMNAMRLRDGMRLTELCVRTRWTPERLRQALEPLVQRGLLELGADRVCPTARGRRFLNEIVRELLPD